MPTLLVDEPLIPSSIRIVIAQIDTVNEPGFQRKEHVQPAGVRLVPLFSIDSRVGQQQISAAAAVGCQIETRNAAEYSTAHADGGWR